MRPVKLLWKCTRKVSITKRNQRNGWEKRSEKGRTKPRIRWSYLVRERGGWLNESDAVLDSEHEELYESWEKLRLPQNPFGIS